MQFFFIAAMVLTNVRADVTQDTFGLLHDKLTGTQHEITRFTLTNQRGMKVQVINYGATVTSILVPDRDGQFAEVTLGFDDLNGYVHNSFNPYFGAIIGRVANRIKGASFVLNGHRYNVSSNIGINQLHGGFKGFDKRLWSYSVENEKSVKFSYLSADGEEGFPGELQSHVTYSLNDENELDMSIEATTNKPTPVNLVNHVYFNLAGHETGATGLYNHIISINANSYTPLDEEFTPTGEIREVIGTVYDLRFPKLLKDVMPQTPNGDGYDINYSVNRDISSDVSCVARVVHSESGRVLEVYSNQPGVQFYTTNSLSSNTTEELIGRGGAIYRKHAAFCLETQAFPDAVNHSNFPSIILYPGQVYKHMVSYRFGITNYQ